MINPEEEQITQNAPRERVSESAVHAELLDYCGSSLTLAEYSLLIYRFHPQLQLGQSSASGLRSLRGACAEAEINPFHRFYKVNRPTQCCLTFPGRSLLSCRVWCLPENVYTCYRWNVSADINLSFWAGVEHSAVGCPENLLKIIFFYSCDLVHLF